MRKIFSKIKAAVARQVNYLRRRRMAIKTFARTRKDGVIRYYDTIAIPQTLEQKMYDVRTKRYALGGSTVEVIENVWTRQQVQDHVHLCA